METYLHPLVSPVRVNWLLLNASQEGQKQIHVMIKQLEVTYTLTCTDVTDSSCLVSFFQTRP